MLSNFKAALALVCLLALTVDALRASSIEELMRKRGRMSYMKSDFPPVKSDVPTQWTALPIDHSGRYQGYFWNRYWYNATWYKPGGPVFFQDVGESNAQGTGAALEYDGDFTHTAVMRLAKRYHGVAVVWEHRYYGESLPFPVSLNTTREQWQFHTVEQALDDVIYFAQRFSFPHPDNRAILYRPHPYNTPWIVIGGSYPGVRAAFLRIKNPGIIYASWSSSAPVQAQMDMSSYWQAAERALPRNCSNDWVAVTKYVDGVFTNGSEQDIYDLKARIITAEFSGPGGNKKLLEELDSLREVDDYPISTVAYYLMDPLGHYQVNGLSPILTFCDAMETRNGTIPAYTEGLAAKFGISVALDSFLIGLAETDPDTSAVTGPPDTAAADWLSWQYQYCTEFGFFQAYGPYNNRSIQSKFLTQSSYQRQCLEIFPAGSVPAEPNVGALNSAYGGWRMNPTHVFFTNGQIDPWRTLSIGSFEENAPKRVGTTAIPACHTAPDYRTYFGVVYRGKTHVKDLWSYLTEPTEPFYTSLALFQMALDEWLPCFFDERW